MAEAFLTGTPEAAEHNQYWYSAPTVRALVEAALELAGREAAGREDGSPGRIAFVSTPSLYFALAPEKRAGHAVLDLDTQWAADPGFVRFDFNAVDDIPVALRGAFDVVVIDPPFITEPVWRAYAAAAGLLLRKGTSGAAICTTVAENEPLLAGLFPGMKAVPWQPSIPHLVYQYNTFVNADPPPAALAARNPEIPE